MNKDPYIQWLRSKVGKRKIFLPYATVIVRDERHNILLQKRNDLKVWGLPGGVLELDEDLQSCARRELVEETGLTAGPLRLVGVYTDPQYDVVYPNGDQVQQFTICFEAMVNGGTMQPDGLEASEQGFFSLEAIHNLEIPNWYRDMIRDASESGFPTFNPPRSLDDTQDQIAVVRPHIRHARYTGTGASAVIEDNKGRILMLRHNGERYWRPPAGFSDLGENVAYTAVREVKEETGLDIEPERILAVHSTPRLNVTYPNGDKVRNVGVVFKAKLLGGHAVVDGREIDELAWMSREDALNHYNVKHHWFVKKMIHHLDDGHFVC